MNTRRMDYHLHTTHSMDGRQILAEAACRAAELGLEEICITEHLETGHPGPGADIPPVFADWLKDIRAAREKHPGLVIRAGLEIGDNAACRDTIYAQLDSLPLDYRLLSLHLVNGKDPYEADYFDGKTQASAYLEYAEKLVDSVTRFSDYDAAAHIGYVGKFAPYPAETRPMRLHHAKEAIDAVLIHLAREGKALEINASGLIQTDSPIPGADIIKRFLEVGGMFFTFGSDAHQLDRVYLHVERAKEIARAQGAKWQAGFENRVMRVFKI